MELDFDEIVAHGLRHYVRLVSRALGLRGESSFVQPDEPLSAYLALDGRLPHFPDRDVALVWDEHQGWSAAIETHSGEDLLVVAYLGREALPPPEDVAAWVRRLFHPLHRVGPVDQRPHLADTDRTRQRLAAYVDPAFGVSPADRSRGGGEKPLAIGW
jgi:hypothetical protein